MTEEFEPREFDDTSTFKELPDIKGEADSPRIANLWHQQFPEDVSIPVAPGVDGMPELQPKRLALAPNVNPETLSCIADRKNNRPACKHYRRQLLLMEDEPVDGGHRQLNRYCAALADHHGTLYNIKDTAVFACELRDPPDPKAAAIMEKWEEREAELYSEKRVGEDDFDIDAELQKEED